MNAGADLDRKQGGTRMKTLPLPVLLGIMLLAGLCTLLALNTASAAQELQQRSLTEANANASDQEQQLLRDLAAKQAPASLAAAAARQGLVPNPNPAFLRINANGSVTVLGSPLPASSPVVAPSPVLTPSATPTAAKTPASKTPTSSKTPASPTTSSKTPTSNTAASSKTRASTPAARPSSSRPTSRPKPTPHVSPSSTGGHR